MAFPLDAVAGVVGKIIDRVWQDPATKDAAKLELLKLQQSGELAQLAAETDLAKGQLEINKAEAENPNLFVSGARPAMMWCCVLIFAANFLFVPLLAWASANFGWVAPPRLDVTEVMPVLMGILGLGAYRSFEKSRGVA